MCYSFVPKKDRTEHTSFIVPIISAFHASLFESLLSSKYWLMKLSHRDPLLGQKKKSVRQYKMDEN